MAYPRKFRDKIALQMQKQAEETRLFEEVLREVSISTRPTSSITTTTSSLLQPVHSQMARSLPNVNQMVSNSIDLQNALIGLEEMKKEIKYGNGTQHRGATHGTEVQLRERSTNLVQKRSPSRDRLRASSPYGSRNYLSPPSADNSWRRATSDPSLHSSVSASQAPSSVGHSAASSSSNVRSDVDSGLALSQTQTQLASFVSQPLQVPSVGLCSSANSGSLPDLTNLNFPPPLSNPLDVSESSHDKISVSQHSHRINRVTPLVFGTATKNHLLAGGSVVSNNQCQSPPRHDGHSVFSPMSPQPMITLTDASANVPGAREEILYSEDLDAAIQEYLFNVNSPMVSLSPSFFRLSGSTPPALLKNNLPSVTNLESAALPSKSSYSNTYTTSFQDSKTVCNEISISTDHGPPTYNAPSLVSNGVSGMNRPRVSQQQQQQLSQQQQVFMPQQQTLTEWNQLQRELLQLQQIDAAAQQMQNSHQLHSVIQQQLLERQQSQQQHNASHSSQQMQSVNSFYKQQLPQPSQQLRQETWSQQHLAFGQQPSSDARDPNVTLISEFSDIANRMRQPPPYSSINLPWDMAGVVTSSGMLTGGCNDAGGQMLSNRVDAFNDVSQILSGNGDVHRQSSVCRDLHDVNSLDFELLASDDVSTLGLDPLALDELQMLTGSPIFSDPNIEETFRCDHNFNNYRLM